MNWIFLHLFKEAPYSLSLFLGTSSREPLAEIQPDSAVLLIRALRRRPHTHTHTHTHTHRRTHRNPELFCCPPCLLQASLPSTGSILESKLSQAIMIKNPPKATVRINLSSVKHSVQLVLSLLFKNLHTLFLFLLNSTTLLQKAFCSVCSSIVLFVTFQTASRFKIFHFLTFRSNVLHCAPHCSKLGCSNKQSCYFTVSTRKEKSVLLLISLLVLSYLLPCFVL